MERRDILKASAAGFAAAVAGAPAGAASTAFAPPETIDEGGMKYRILGRTGERVSLVGLGGFHLAKPEPDGPTLDDAVRIVRGGIDAGINFCDNCWDYNGGESEVRLGIALRDGYRQRAFVMTKLDGRTAAAANAQLEQSLQRLRTDHIDLVQFHEIIRMDDPDRVFAAGGALEALVRAKEQGKVRYIGFTGHKSPAIHRKMFETAAAHGFRFDTVQMPVNVMDAHYDSFLRGIVPIALDAGTAVLAMKTFGDTFVLDTHVASPIEMLHFSMSQPVSVVITGIDRIPILEQALAAVRTYRPMTEAEQTALLARSADDGRAGAAEPYKVSTHFDGTTQNPHWLERA